MSSLTVLFAPAADWGKVNACHGLAEELLRRGHRIVFAVDQAFRGQLEKYGFEEVLHTVSKLNHESDAEVWPKYVANNAKALKGNPMEIIESFSVNQFDKLLAESKSLDNHYRKVIAIIRPDVIVVDSYVCSPVLTNSGIPWVALFSAAPLWFLNDQTIPPPFSGLKFKCKGEGWEEFRQQFNENFAKLRQNINDWYITNGAPELLPNQLHPHSPYLNIYVYPKELDYYSKNTIQPKNWLRVDSFVRTADEHFVITSELAAKPGKLILVNMGSVGSADLQLMRKLVANLSRSSHKFIVITGALNGKYELAANMYGQAVLPQTQVMPAVDLVVTDGSNQSVVECFYFGKPLIVLPLFGDQFENGQRVKETGFGLTLNPYTCCMTSLVAVIDALLDDLSLNRRLSYISRRIQNSNDKKRAVDLIETIVETTDLFN